MYMKIQRPLLLAGMLALAILGAGCMQYQAQPQTAGTTSPAGATITVTATSLGNILTDAQGKTLYYFARDTPSSGMSTCYGQCAALWPVFSANTIVVSPPLVSSDFSSITRTDGTTQTTYRGWPLYYFQSDSGTGSVNGEGITGNWFVIRPDETVMVAQRDTLGTYLTDTMGNTLYFFGKDTNGVSACTGACLAKWPAFSVKTVSAPSILNPSDFGSLARPDGINQTTYRGRPLYYFVNDTKPGDANGEGFLNVWYVANITGTVPALPATPAPAATTTMQTMAPATTAATPSSMSSGGY